ncbi:MAG: SDR family NAD(P)-dependent oxidoreductase, partial [Clostridiales bacterium]
MFIDVKDKIVVITGASKGIGKGLALGYAKEGAKVVLNYLNSEKESNLLINEISLFNKNCISIRADVSKIDDVREFCKKTIDIYGRVDILINNAGICSDNSVVNMSDDQWDSVLNVNLKGVFNVCKVFSKDMIKNRMGKIINISSIKGTVATANQVNYSVSKSGVNVVTKVLAKELCKFGISVNSICPGFIITDLNKNSLSKIKAAKKLTSLDTRYSFEDLLNFIILLSSDSIKNINGQIFNIDSRII